MAKSNPTVADLVIESFGGLAKTAKALGHRHASTVFGWQKKGSIPRWRRAEILAAADRERISLPVEYLRQSMSKAA